MTSLAVFVETKLLFGRSFLVESFSNSKMRFLQYAQRDLTFKYSATAGQKQEVAAEQ